MTGPAPHRNTPARGGLALAALVAAGCLRSTPAAGQVMDNHIYRLVLFDQLEYRRIAGAHPIGWDMVGWIGGDFTRLWVKSEGRHSTRSGGGEVEVQALYSRLIAPFWEFQAGLQMDTRYGPGLDRTRIQAVIGLEGLAPYWFEVEPALFVSQAGDVSARVTTTYDMFLTQRLLLQPRVDISAAVQEVPEFRVGSGLNEVGLGFRLRYEIRREWAPYLGVRWVRLAGATAGLARLAGEEVSEFGLVGGLRLWF